MDSVRWEDHRGRRYLLMDGSRNDRAAAWKSYEDFHALLYQEPLDSVRVLADFSDSYYESELTDKWKKAVEKDNTYVVQGALVGIEGGMKIMIAAYAFFARLRGVPVDKKLRYFESREQALAWLFEEGSEA